MSRFDGLSVRIVVSYFLGCPCSGEEVRALRELGCFFYPQISTARPPAGTKILQPLILTNLH